MISLCSSADNILSLFKVESKERLEREVAVRDAIIETLRKQMNLMTDTTTYNGNNDNNDNNDNTTTTSNRDSKNQEKNKPRASSCSDLTKFDTMNSLYSSSLVWNLSGSGMECNDEVEYTYSQILNDDSEGSLNLDNDGCLLVYSCPKSLVKYLKSDFVEEQRRRWLLRSDFIVSLNN